MKSSFSFGIMALLSMLGCGGVGVSSAPTLTGNWVITAEIPNPAVLNASGGITYTTINSWAYFSQSGASVSGIVASNLCSSASATFPVSGTLQNNNLQIYPSGTAEPPLGAFSFLGIVSSDLASLQTGRMSLLRVCELPNYNPYYVPMTGQQIPSVAGNWAGTLTSTSGPSTTISASLIESEPVTPGFPLLSGNVVFSGSPCFSTGAFAGTQFGPNVSGSITTTNGTLVIPQFGGLESSLNSRNQLYVSYSIQGGTCNGDTEQGTLTLQ